MIRPIFRLIVGTGVLASVLAACGGAAGQHPDALVPVSDQAHQTQEHVAALSVARSAPPSNYKLACDSPRPVQCFALVRTDAGDAPQSSERGRAETGGSPSGYGPAELQAAYNLPSETAGKDQTVALVEIGDYPTAESDLATYRSKYGLPECTTTNHCFSKVGQTGDDVPREDAGWSEETALDMDMVSAVCPNCHILIVEADNEGSADDMATAENEAVKLGATEVSNSFGSRESDAANAAYAHPGVVITASAGDEGYTRGPKEPCAYATVVCTGGTSLVAASNARGYTESVWNDLRIRAGATGSGCSTKVDKPSWQTDRGCPKRSATDLSFAADPEHGLSVYDSTPYEDYSGWLVFGGSSAASPAIAAVFALAGNAKSLGPNAAEHFWKSSGADLWPITTGDNVKKDKTCDYLYLCTAGTHVDGNYSGPAGWGTPNGISAF